MAKTKVEGEILELEKRYWKAIKDQDMDTALSLTADPCLVTGSQGVNTIDKKTFAKMMKESPWTLDSYELKDFQAIAVNDELVLAAYKVKESITVDGKPLQLEVADSSTWIKQDGQWVCALHSEAILGDPFGRDKRAAA